MIELVSLTGKEATKYSNLFRLAMDRAAPPYVKMTDAKFRKVMKSMENGKKTGWLVSENDKLMAVAITQIIEDEDMGTRDVLIYCVYALDKLSPEVWVESFKQMSKYGLSKKCKAMTAFTRVDKVKQMAIQMGGNAEMVYLNIPLRRG